MRVNIQVERRDGEAGVVVELGLGGEAGGEGFGDVDRHETLITQDWARIAELVDTYSDLGDQLPGRSAAKIVGGRSLVERCSVSYDMAS